jgi:transcriptional regulator with XRE-family HTH domain
LKNGALKIYIFGQNHQNISFNMDSFGEYLRELREAKGLPLRKVAAELDVDTSILSKIERNERNATIEMIPVLADVLDKPEKEIQIRFLKFCIIRDYGKLTHLKSGLQEIIKEL